MAFIAQLDETVDESADSSFQSGDTVLARWTDCRSYPGTVLRQTEEGKIEVAGIVVGLASTVTLFGHLF